MRGDDFKSCKLFHKMIKLSKAITDTRISAQNSRLWGWFTKIRN